MSGLVQEMHRWLASMEAWAEKLNFEWSRVVETKDMMLSEAHAVVSCVTSTSSLLDIPCVLGSAVSLIGRSFCFLHLRRHQSWLRITRPELFPAPPT